MAVFLPTVTVTAVVEITILPVGRTAHTQTYEDFTKPNEYMHK